jgi:hypothetical protein
MGGFVGRQKDGQSEPSLPQINQLLHETPNLAYTAFGV